MGKNISGFSPTIVRVLSLWRITVWGRVWVVEWAFIHPRIILVRWKIGTNAAAWNVRSRFSRHRHQHRQQMADGMRLPRLSIGRSPVPGPKAWCSNGTADVTLHKRLARALPPRRAAPFANWNKTEFRFMFYRVLNAIIPDALRCGKYIQPFHSSKRPVILLFTRKVFLLI